MTEVLKALHDIGIPRGEMAHLFLATCMISSDNTVASYAAEIWTQGVTENNVNSELIGTILAKHEQIEFAPDDLHSYPVFLSIAINIDDIK